MTILGSFLLPLFGMIWRNNRYDLAAVVIVVTSVSAWITGIRMRRKIRRDLGKKASDADLTSIDTWMKVEEAEERNQAKKPLG